MKDFLTNLFGAEIVTEDNFAKFAAELGKRFVAKTDFNAKLEEIKGLNTQISERDKQLKDLKSSVGDNDDLKQQIETLQNANKTAKENYEKEILGLKFNTALELALAKCGAKSTKAVKALLNLDELKYENDAISGLDEQIEGLKKEYDYMFGVNQTSTGMPQGGTPTGMSEVERRFYERNPDLKTD